MKQWIKTAIGVSVIVCAMGAAATITVLSHKLKSKTEFCENLKERTAEQSRVIDSLLNRRMTVFDVQMHVRDQSKFTIYGKYNKGTIKFPSLSLFYPSSQKGSVLDFSDTYIEQAKHTMIGVLRIDDKLINPKFAPRFLRASK